MAAIVPAREFKSEAEMRAHYAALHRKCFEPVPVPVKRVDEEPQKDEEPAANMLDHEAWAEYVGRVKEMYGVADIKSLQQREGRASITGFDAIRIVTEITGHSHTALKGTNRTQNVVRARQIAFWLLVNRAGKSLQEAGRLLGNKDHTTALHGCRRAHSALDTISPPLPASPEGIAQLLWVISWPRLKQRPSKRANARRTVCVLCGGSLKAPA